MTADTTCIRDSTGILPPGADNLGLRGNLAPLGVIDGFRGPVTTPLSSRTVAAPLLARGDSSG